MKIICTLKEFELLLQRCPMHAHFISDKKFEELLDKCNQNCLLYNFCKYGEDGCGYWSLADLVEVIPQNNMPEGGK